MKPLSYIMAIKIKEYVEMKIMYFINDNEVYSNNLYIHI